ncbi:hypothetical protein MTYP_02401 [Methylophilaceae bacterium]|nr:hypothetical protein MTYP_02401 [Methylophilaceae bacterium]
MKSSKSTLALVAGGAFAVSIAATSVVAAENPFLLKPLSSGYMVADHHGEKGAEGKCGTGKCGAERKSEKEASCGAEKKGAEAKCGAEKKTEAEGKCGTEKK